MAGQRWGSVWRLDPTQGQPSMKETWEAALGRSLGVSCPPVQTEQQEKSAVGPSRQGANQDGRGPPSPASPLSPFSGSARSKC